MADHYDLFYYDSRGLVEPIRQILSYAEKTSGITWTDNRTPITQFPTVLPPDWKARTPYAQVPLLEFNGHKLSQSQAIARFLAKKYDLAGSDDLESAKCDEIADSARDLLFQFFPLYLETDPEKLPGVKETAITNTKDKFFATFNKLAGENEGKHLVGDQLTWADIIVTSNIDHLQRTFDLKLLDDFPHLQTLLQTTQATPGIKEWIEKRPATQF